MQQFREVSKTRTTYSTETHTSDFILLLFLNLSCMQTYYFTSFFFSSSSFFFFFFFFFLSLFFCLFVFVCYFLSLLLFFFSLWFIGLLHRFFLLCVCVFGQTLTIAQFHTSVYKYVKYIAQGCCESVMDIFLRGCTWTLFLLIIMHSSNLILFQIKRIDQNIYHICIY